MIQKVKGTYDILPEESQIWQYLEKNIKELCNIYDIKEVRIPIIEYTDVFTKSIGEETDIVSKEMYSFETRSKKSITLRPEGTAGIARCYSENKIYGRENLSRWFYFGPMFRAEQPQKGRQRQFHQFGIEIIGSESPIFDAEVINFNMELLSRLGLKNIQLKINSVGDEVSRPIYIEKLKDYFKNELSGLCKQCNVRYEKNILRMLDCKDPLCQSILDNAPAFVEHLSDESSAHFNKVRELISHLDYDIDKRLVRGLDYYTQTAFEITCSDLGSQNAIAGGGRYDNLIEVFSGKKTPAVGSAIGLERLIIALQAANIDVNNKSVLDIYLTYFEDDFVNKVFSIQNILRKNGISVRMSDKAKKIGSQLKDADREGAKFALILGDEEIKTEKYTLKNLKSGEQIKGVELNFIIDTIKKSD